MPPAVPTAILDTALAVRRGQVKLADVPVAARANVVAALRKPSALLRHAREKAYHPREGRFVSDGAFLNRR